MEAEDVQGGHEVWGAAIVAGNGEKLLNDALDWQVIITAGLSRCS